MVSYHPAKPGGHNHSDSRDMMVLLYSMILQKHMIEASFDFISRNIWVYGWEPPMGRHHPGMFGGQRPCGSGDMMVERQDSTCYHLNPSLLFIFKAHSMRGSHKQNFRT